MTLDKAGSAEDPVPTLGEIEETRNAIQGGRFGVRVHPGYLLIRVVSTPRNVRHPLRRKRPQRERERSGWREHSRVRIVCLMSLDPVVALLAKQSVTRLREMESEIRHQIDSLRFQHDLVHRALQGKAQPSVVEPVRPSRSEAQPQRGKRANFREVLNTRPEHEWLPAEVRAELIERGVEVSSAAVRVMLRRMGENHEVVRTERGWKLSSRNGSEELFSGGTENGARDPLFTGARPQEAANE